MEELSYLTYPNFGLNDHTLDHNLPVSQSKPSPHGTFGPAKTSLGVLDRFPPELLDQTLLYLDLRALAAFQCVNRRSAELVNHFPPFKAITTHARNSLRGILSIQTGKWITSITLLEKLYTSDCEECGDFGGYLYILTCRRVCFLCLSRDIKYLPLTIGHACRKFGLKKAEIENLPCMMVLPGIYSPNEKKASRAVLVDYESALNYAIARHGSVDAMQKFVTDQDIKRLEDYERRVRLAQQAGSARQIRKPPTGDPHDGQSGNPFRFVAIVLAPWLNRSSPNKTEWGFYCLGCERSSRFPLHMRRKFIASSFHRHIQQCGDIKNGVHQTPRIREEVEVTEAG